MRGWSGFLTPAAVPHTGLVRGPRTRHMAKWTCQIISFPGTKQPPRIPPTYLWALGAGRGIHWAREAMITRRHPESIRHGGWATALNIPDEKFSISSFLIFLKIIRYLHTSIWSNKLIFFSSSDCNCRYENTISIDKLTWVSYNSVLIISGTRDSPRSSASAQSWKGTWVSFWEAVICIMLRRYRKGGRACMTGKPTLNTLHPPFLPGLLLHHQEVREGHCLKQEQLGYLSYLTWQQIDRNRLHAWQLSVSLTKSPQFFKGRCSPNFKGIKG